MISPANLFSDPTQISIVEKQKAELYMQIYQYAAEDFLTVADANSYAIRLTEYFVSLETQLARLFAMSAKHVHVGVNGVTSQPIGGDQYVWQFLKQPVLMFTPLLNTGALASTSGPRVPNLFNNYIIPGIAQEGALSFGARRAMPIMLLTMPSIPPLISSTIKGIL